MKTRALSASRASFSNRKWLRFLSSKPAINAGLLALAVAGVATSAHAAAGYTITSQGGTGILQNITTLLTNIVEFASTTLGEVIVVIGFVLAVIGWVAAPRSGAIGIAVRACCGAIVVFNLTSLISYFTLT